jgi:hypothetical protein
MLVWWERDCGVEIGVPMFEDWRIACAMGRGEGREECSREERRTAPWDSP